MAKKKLTSKAAILELQDRPVHEFHVPSWDATVFVRELTAYQRDNFGATMDTDDPQNVATLRSRLIALSLVDDDGELLFSQSEVKDLGGKSSKAIDELWDFIRELNGMVADEDAVEEAEKN